MHGFLFYFLLHVNAHTLLYFRFLHIYGRVGIGSDRDTATWINTIAISNMKHPPSVLLVHGIMIIRNSGSAVVGINIHCYYLQPTPDPSDNSEQALSTAAIVIIVVGSYLALVIIALLIRQCLKVG